MINQHAEYMDNNQIEKIFSETFSGLTLFYRDTNLSDELISKYQTGQLIMERGFTDMTYMGGGTTSNLRYLIASAFGTDLSAFNPDAAKVGHVVLTANSYFKVLDIYRVDHTTQVFLLNIPAHGIDLFQQGTSNVEEEIIQKARDNFDANRKMEPIPELQNSDWLERTSFPIGMNDNGLFFFDPSSPHPIGDEQPLANTGNITPPETKKPWWKIW
ncbi:MAG: hypothetical protein NTW29_20765 [Bacteroidetes bacterium]|nr:hypothetical protein [Bacteroidota bacterium]